jgi:magnesium-transporting ATPase (P-type)
MYQCYNMFYTSLPVIIYALFDEEFNGDFLTNRKYIIINLSDPSYYEQGPNDSLFNYSVFLYWIGFGAF